MSNLLISVIVPVYMIDKFIGLCIESIINQTYEDLEIILVDDGSKDRCSEICDLYKKKDSRIRVIHKPNGGLVSARKAGLSVANGDYVSYVDGDDWVERQFIETLYRGAIDSKADVVCAGYTRDLFSKSQRFTNNIPEGIYEDDMLRILWCNMISYGTFFRPGISTYVWNKLFKKDILAGVQKQVDERIRIGEDAAVTYPALLTSKSVVVVNDASYHYRQREDSMLKQTSSYTKEIRELKYLYDYMTLWSAQTQSDGYIKSQIVDFVLSLAIIRSGGCLPYSDKSYFKNNYYAKDVVVYSAGTFGQQLVKRLSETPCCNVVAWIDDDYWEYRRCCLDVDPVESISTLNYDYVLVATVDSVLATAITNRLVVLGVQNEKILTINVSGDKLELLNQFFDFNKR